MRYPLELIFDDRILVDFSQRNAKFHSYDNRRRDKLY